MKPIRSTNLVYRLPLEKRVKLLEWYKARKALGTVADKAEELGIPAASISTFAHRELEKERIEHAQKRRKIAAPRMSVYEQMRR